GHARLVPAVAEYGFRHRRFEHAERRLALVLLWGFLRQPALVLGALQQFAALHREIAKAGADSRSCERAKHRECLEEEADHPPSRARPRRLLRRIVAEAGLELQISSVARPVTCHTDAHVVLKAGNWRENACPAWLWSAPSGATKARARSSTGCRA